VQKTYKTESDHMAPRKLKKKPSQTRTQANQTKIKIKPLYPTLVTNTDIEFQSKLTLEVSNQVTQNQVSHTSNEIKLN
jgi:hypothetical protein